MLGISGEGAAEGPKLCSDDIAALVRLVLEDGDFLIPVKLQVAVVCCGKFWNDYLQSSAPLSRL